MTVEDMGNKMSVSEFNNWKLYYLEKNKEIEKAVAGANSANPINLLNSPEALIAGLT